MSYLEPPDKRLFPYWRQVKYTDEGCVVFQCLACKKDWESRTSPDDWSFCPYCGVQWVGKHECVEHGCRLDAVYEKHEKIKTLPTYPTWAIQSRPTNCSYPVGWSDTGYKYHKKCDIISAKKALLAEDNHYEYRIVRWYPIVKIYGQGDILPLGRKPGEMLRRLTKRCLEDTRWNRRAELKFE